MKISVESTSACRKSVRVELSPDEVNKEFGDVLGLYARAARVPGFRPGKAPRELVKRRYAKDIAGEVRDRLVPKGFQEAVKQEKLKMEAVLDVKEPPVEEGQPFAFTVLLDVAPEFELPAYTGVPVEGHAAEVKDEDVQQTIDNLRGQSGKFEDVTGRGVEKGDLVQIDFTATVDGQPLETVVPKAVGLGQGKDFALLADEEQAFLPGLVPALLGAAAGEQRQAAVEFPADFALPELAGRKALYDVTVKGIRARKLAELDDAFYKSLRVDSLESLQQRIREELQEMRAAGERRRREGEVIRFLLANTQLDIPESLLAEETQGEVYDQVQEIQYRGASREDIENRKEEIFESAARTAADRIKLRYILQRIAEAEKIAAPPAKVASRIAALAQRRRTTPEKMLEELRRRNTLRRLEEEVRLQETIGWVLEKAQVTMKESA